MIINEDLKKDVDKKASTLKLLTLLLSREQDRINVLFASLHIVILCSVVILILYYFAGRTQSYMLLPLPCLLSILSIVLKIELKRSKKRYDNIYVNSFNVMCELTDLTEWTNLRKRYILGNKDFVDMITVDNYIATIERKFSPHRSILNYYKLLSIESSILVYSIIIIETILIYLYLS